MGRGPVERCLSCSHRTIAIDFRRAPKRSTRGDDEPWSCGPRRAAVVAAIRPSRRRSGRRRPHHRPQRDADQHGSALSLRVAEQQPTVARPGDAGGDGRRPQLEPGACHVVEGDRRHHVGIQPAQGSEIPRRIGLHRGRRRFLVQARARRAQQSVVVCHFRQEHRHDDGGRSLHHSLQDEDAFRRAADQPEPGVHPVPYGGGRAGPRRQDHRSSSMPATDWPARAPIDS